METGQPARERYLTQLRIKNFKCLKDVTIPLRRMTVIYGQNSSGKSTILQSIDLIRIACHQLKAKEAQIFLGRTSGRDSSSLSPVNLAEYPWYSFWEDMLHDPTLPIECGLTFVSKPPAGSGTRRDINYVAVDFVLDNKWDVRNNRGSNLPQQIRFRFRFGALDEHRGADDEGADIDIAIFSREEEHAGGAHRQFGRLSIGVLQAAEFTREHSGDNQAALTSILREGIDLGPCPFFRRIEKRPWPASVDGNKSLHDHLNHCLGSTWDCLDRLLSVADLSSSASLDLAHIPASLPLGRLGRLGRDRQRIEDTTLLLPRGIFGRFSKHPDRLLAELNEDFRKLDIPHSITTDGLRDLRANRNTAAHSLSSVGYGIQYILPRLAALRSRNGLLCCIEEPEAHVHPGLQAALGELFLSHIVEHEGQLLIESHSENLMLKVKRCVAAEHECSPDASARIADSVLALYVERPQSIVQNEINGTSGEPVSGKSLHAGAKVTPIRLDEQGQFADYWPQGFFPERHQLDM